MRAKPMLIVAGLLAVGLALYGLAPSLLHAQESPPSMTACNVLFEATVRQGPSSGTELKGTLQVTIDETGALSGNLVIDANTSVPVYGQVTGRAINLALDLSTAEQPGVYVFGVGTALDPIQSKSCGTALGGPFVGPQPGDSGDWDSFCDGAFTTKLPSGTSCDDIKDSNTGRR